MLNLTVFLTGIDLKFLSDIVVEHHMNTFNWLQSTFIVNVTSATSSSDTTSKIRNSTNIIL